MIAMSETATMSLAGMVVSSLTTIVTAYLAYKMKAIGVAVKRTEQNTNSMRDALVLSEKKVSFTEGHAAGIEQEKAKGS